MIWFWWEKGLKPIIQKTPNNRGKEDRNEWRIPLKTFFLLFLFPNHHAGMIEVVLNDRVGKKIRVKCNEDDTIGDLKKVAAAMLGMFFLAIPETFPASPLSFDTLLCPFD